MGTIGHNVDEVFKYHSPKGDQPQRYEIIRIAAKEFAQVIVDNAPVSSDQEVALGYLRNAVMYANSAIALKGII